MTISRERVVGLLPSTGRLIALVLIMIGVMASVADAQSRGRVDQFTLDTIARSDEIIASVQDDKTLRSAIGDAHRLADYVSAHAGARQLDAMVVAESTLSVLSLVPGGASQFDPAQVMAKFGESRAFMTQLGLLVDEGDKATNVVRVAMELMTQRQAQVDRYPALAAAICVVHDLPANAHYSVRINENSPRSPEPIEIFDFFVANAGTMYIPPDQLPALALVFVVDVTESVDQLQWAHNTYRNSPGIDQRFFEIMYDYEHYRQGKTKKVTQAGNYSIQQIKKYGGVCADQAYYAMSVAKACGIPSGYVRAKGADSSHAWVGYLDKRGRRASWNFDAGRYEDYQNLRGNMRDPQSGKRVSDGRIGILGDAVSAMPDAVLHSMAAGRVVDRMNSNQWQQIDELDLDSKGNSRDARTDSVEDRLSLLRMTLAKCAGVPRAWDQVVELAIAGEMDEKQMDVWSRAVMQLSGKVHQDFSFDFLGNLISTIKDPQRQHEMWEWSFGQFRARPDLASAVRYQQGFLWELNNKPEMAWIAYKDILDKFLNDGPMGENALKAMGRMLGDNDKRDAFLPLLQETARRVNRPDEMATNFAKQSNFYKVNRLLVLELEYHNRDGEARVIRDMIKMPASE